jgi:hypothetical protein
MICPRCLLETTSPVGESHYVCNNERCNDINGKRTQFRFVPDTKVHFPHNVIFIDRKRQDFYRKPYLMLKPIVEKI